MTQVRGTRADMATIRAMKSNHLGRPSAIPAEIEDRIYDLRRSSLSASAIARLQDDEGATCPTARPKRGTTATSSLRPVVRWRAPSLDLTRLRRVADLIDSDLEDWAGLASREWPSLLLGNGLSINLWAGFRYDSLFASATLTPQAEAIFAELGTTNFEQCLECLHHANISLRALHESTSKVDQTYAEVRDALFETVSDVHMPWGVFPQRTHDLIATTMNEHRNVFTTSYDLCLYWSHLQTDKAVNIIDYFWESGRRFDVTNTEVRSARATRVHYLHGGLHLWTDDSTGEDGKWTSADGRLLDVIKSQYGPTTTRRPLFVSEGTSAAKLRTIRQSPYLAFCLEELRDDESPTVLFGHSLAGQDAHIAAALNEGKSRRIAVSMYPSGDENAIIAEKARILRQLPSHTIRFFDSMTHPVGDPALCMSPP